MMPQARMRRGLRRFFGIDSKNPANLGILAGPKGVPGSLHNYDGVKPLKTPFSSNFPSLLNFCKISVQSMAIEFGSVIMGFGETTNLRQLRSQFTLTSSKSMRHLLFLGLILLASSASAGIVVRPVATVVDNGATTSVTLNVYAGSDSNAVQNVAQYSVALDVTSIVSHFAYLGPFNASSVTFANPSGNNFTSLWATPGINNPFGPFTGSPGSVVGNVVTFTGGTGQGFGTNVPITAYAEDAAHRMGTISFTFTSPAPATSYAPFSITPTSASFAEYVPPNSNQASLQNVTASLQSGSFTITAVPEPSSLLLGLTFVTGLGLRRRRK